MVLDAKIARDRAGNTSAPTMRENFTSRHAPQAAPTWEPYALDPVPPDVRAEVEFHSRHLWLPSPRPKRLIQGRFAKPRILRTKFFYEQAKKT